MKTELCEKEINLLKRCYNQKHLEYRDSVYRNLKDFEKEDFVSIDKEYFLARNEDGTLEIAENLAEQGFLEYSSDAWHNTFVLSQKGLKAVENNNFFLEIFTLNDLKKAYQAGKENIDFLTFINNNYDLR